MKSKLLLLMAVLTLFISCGLEDAGKSQCAIDLEDSLESYDDTYQYNMTNAKDSKGNGTSLEACLIRKGLTEDYIQYLERKQDSLYFDGGCTSDEKSRLNTQINDRLRDLNEDMESTWNRCEEVYGG